MIESPIKKGQPHRVQKGQVINPNGRPKGCYSEYKKQFIEIQKLAAGKASKVFELLENAIEAGEGWAHQIYWKELFALPKRYLEERVMIPKLSEDQSLNISARIKAYLEAHDEFGDHTREEVLTALKVFSSLKINEVLEESATHEQMSKEEMRRLVDDMTRVIDHAEGDKEPCL
jgi:hypothetical protein